jgi:5-methylcytosine-specific restriction endonuclease McrA
MTAILRVDASGNPLHWITMEDAAVCYAKKQVLWTQGDPFSTLHGGLSRKTGKQSLMEIHPVIAIKGKPWTKWRTPALTNQALFRRDHHICMYCKTQYQPCTRQLTRDHIIPTSRKGRDIWTNVVTACVRCNSRKDNRLLDECGMKLIAVPYVPNVYEYMYMIGRTVMADQMEFLSGGFKNFKVQ